MVVVGVVVDCDGVKGRLSEPNVITSCYRAKTSSNYNAMKVVLSSHRA